MYPPVKHFSFIGITRNEPINLDGLILTNPVAASLSLEVILGIPVGVINDDGVCRSEVDAKTTSSRAQQKHKPI